MFGKFLKIIDGLIGPALVRLCPSAKRKEPPPTSVNSVLMVRPGGIGDAILMIPAITCLRENYPDASIDVLAEKRNQGVLDLCPSIDNVYEYDKWGGLLSCMLNEYDVVIDTEQWYRLSSLVTRFVRSKVKIGFGTNERKRMLTDIVEYHNNEYEAEAFLRLLSPLGIQKTAYSVPWLTIPEDVSARMECVDRFHLPEGYLVIFAGGSAEEKKWSNENFRSLLKYLLREKYQVVVVGSDKDYHDAELIIAGLDVLNLCGQTDLKETAAIIDNASLLICGDSGVLHIAAGLGRPTVSLFGPSNLHKWAPRGAMHRVISSNIPCSPCSRFGTIPKCSNNQECLQSITHDDVIAALDGLLKG